MSRTLLSTILIVMTCAFWVAPADAQLVARFEVSNAVFSPDGDAVEDTTNVILTLSAAAVSVSAVVFEPDSITPVDTLLAPQALPSGRTDVGWDGLRWDDSPAGDSNYVVVLSASDGVSPDTTAARSVVVDTGPPSVVVDSVTPNPYAPGVPGQPSELNIAFTVAGATPIYPGIPFDEIQYEFLRPDESPAIPDTIRFEPDYSGANGQYRLVWNATNQIGLADGEYLVTLTIVDQAGHSVTSEHTFLIDAKDPSVSITDPPAGSYQDSPDSLLGWAWDENGIKQVDIQYSTDGPFVPVVINAVVDDTVFFAAPLADSLAAEGKYDLVVRALDDFDREKTSSRIITIDRSAPAPPELDPFEGVWHTNTFRVTGDIPGATNIPSFVRIYRNGEKVDSTFVLPNERIDRDVALAGGRNVLAATFVDAADNESAPSNEVVVTFDDNTGLFIASPLHPGGALDVNLATLGLRAALRVYDLAGDLVVLVEDFTETQNYSFPWTGYNGRGKAVRKGPLVAVVTVQLTSGETQTFREMFLYEPDPR